MTEQPLTVAAPIFTQNEFDTELTKLIQRAELEPKEFIEVFLFAVARVVYCANHSQAQPMPAEEYIVPILGKTVGDALLENLKKIEAMEIPARKGQSIQ